MVNNRTSPIPLAALSTASISHFAICFCQITSHTEYHHVENTYETMNNIASDGTNRSWINNQKKGGEGSYDEFFIRKMKNKRQKPTKTKEAH